MSRKEAEKHDREQKHSERKRPAWRTGTVIDDFNALYEALLKLGFQPPAVDGMDLAFAGVLLGISPRTSDPTAPVPTQGPVLSDGSPAPASSSHGIRPPKFWRGDVAAFSSAVQGARILGAGPPLAVDDPGDAPAPPA